MDRFSRLSRGLGAAFAVAGVVGLLAGCTRAESPEVHASECHRRASRIAVTEASMEAALARQGAANQVYRQCIERRAVRAAR